MLNKKNILVIFLILLSYFCLEIKAQIKNNDVENVTDSSAFLRPSANNCKIYAENAWWLPDAYLHNATCACLVTPDEPKANIIRKKLQEYLVNTPIEVKKQAEIQKNKLLQKKISKKNYNRYVKKILVPLIYKDHVAAYKKAACKGDPAPYLAWKLIATKRVKDCHLIKISIDCLGGSCYNYFCKW